MTEDFFKPFLPPVFSSIKKWISLLLYCKIKLKKSSSQERDSSEITIDSSSSRQTI